MNGNKANLDVDLKGKVVFITGSSDGIGKETTKILAKMGAHVIMACRNETKTMNVIKGIQEEIRYGILEFIPLDLSDLDSVFRASEIFKKKNLPLNILINNAALQSNVEDGLTTKQGYEMMFGVNYLGHFLLNKVRTFGYSHSYYFQIL